MASKGKIAEMARKVQKGIELKQGTKDFSKVRSIHKHMSKLDKKNPKEAEKFSKTWTGDRYSSVHKYMKG